MYNFFFVYNWGKKSIFTYINFFSIYIQKMYHNKGKKYTIYKKTITTQYTYI